VQSQAAELAARLSALTELEVQVRELAGRCRDKIGDPPRLAVPDPTVLGCVPPMPDGPAEPGAWTKSRAELDTYRRRVDQVEAALTEAQRRFAAPLTERAELRGLADAYRTKAGAQGLAEDSALGASYERLRAVLWHAPGDLSVAGPLVRSYVALVQEALLLKGKQAGSAAPELGMKGEVL
jgi:hypothetical protein